MVMKGADSASSFAPDGATEDISQDILGFACGVLEIWCARQDLNLRLPDPQSGVLSRLNYGRTMMEKKEQDRIPRWKTVAKAGFACLSDTLNGKESSREETVKVSFRASLREHG